MRRLMNYMKFDVNSFFKDKRLAIKSIKYSEQKGMLSADIAILYDGTDYGDKNISNLFESFKFHILNTTEADIDKYKPQTQVAIKTYTDVKIYGDFNSCMSITGTLAFVES